jgi:hypothetical protein
MSTTQSANIIVIWICFQKSQPLPEDLIQLWEDYQFMNYCEQIWYRNRGLEVTCLDRDHCSRILSQAPSLIKILQVIKILQGDITPPLFQIHFMLDFSWDELRTAICSLCSLVCDEEEGFLSKLLNVALDPTIFPVHFDLIMWNSACNSLRVMQQIFRGELDKNIMWVFIAFILLGPWL